jgi:transcriptional regulator with XRE-family HTH domain
MTATTTTARVGPELRSARNRAGLTRERLSALAGCSVAWLAHLERGAVPTTSPALDRIWDVLSAFGEPAPREEVSA